MSWVRGTAGLAVCAGLALGAVQVWAAASAEPPALLSGRVWLLVGASDPSPAGVAAKGKALQARLPGGLVVQTADCSDRRNVFAWVAAVATSAEDASARLPALRQLVPDAYIKRCAVRPDSLLSLRLTAVDPSIAEVPGDAVNWSDADRVSALRTLQPASDQARGLLLTRYFSSQANDPLEGRRERVSLVGRDGQLQPLLADCPGAVASTVQAGRVALQCDSEQAADQVLHRVLVFDLQGHQLAEQDRCRQPKWQAPGHLRCEAEQVTASGRLTLKPTRVTLPAP